MAGRPRKTTPTQPGATEVQDVKTTEQSAAPDVNELITANRALGDDNDKLAKQNEELHQQLSQQSAMINKLAARFETLEHQIGQDGVAHFKGDELIRPEKRTLDDPDLLKKLEIEKFMNEELLVEIADVADDQADQGFMIWVNGKPEAFRRGEQKTVKRYFVEGLARAKKTGFRCEEQDLRAAVDNAYLYPSKTGLRYPFAVIKDPSGQVGRDWLKAVLRQP